MSEDYVAYHGWVWLKNAISSHQFGLRIQLKLCHEDDLRVFEDMKKHRKNRAGSGAYRALTRMGDAEEWYGPIDLLYVTWAHSITNGVTITFEMDNQEEWEKIRAAPALAAGNEEGLLPKTEVMLIELDDSGKPINVEQRAKLEKMARQKKWPKGGAQSKRAARLCQDHEFLGWLFSRGLFKSADVRPADVAEWMRQECSIDSRAQLDHDSAALQRFEERIMKPFLRSTM